MKKPSQSLGTISDPSQVKKEGQERRRLPRLNLTRELFRLQQNGKIFSIVDLSLDGMAIRVIDPLDLRLFPMGCSLEGTLNLKKEKYRVMAQVRHLGVDLVGCQFFSLSEEAIEALQKFLDPSFLGQELRPIPSAEGSTIWYHGPPGTDLLFWHKSDGEYHRFLACVHGSYVQWDLIEMLVTGKTKPSHEKSEVRGAIRFDMMLLEKDSEPDPGKLNVAKNLILSSNLPQELKKWCVRRLK